MPKKERLDVLLHSRGLAESREKARRLIMAGEVIVAGNRIDKPGTLVPVDAAVELKAGPRFVSRGGDKLLAALTEFKIDPAGWVCADVGASTGGFTDCLLQHGAAKVYAIDVGQGILDWKLRNDPRVIVMENNNARYVESLSEPVRLATIDAAFISLKLLLPVVQKWLAPNGEIVALIKPQFEAGKNRVGKKGVVRDPEVHREVLMSVLRFAQSVGLGTNGLIRSPLLGPAGNVEFLAHLVRMGDERFRLGWYRHWAQFAIGNIDEEQFRHDTANMGMTTLGDDRDESIKQKYQVQQAQLVRLKVEHTELFLTVASILFRHDPFGINFKVNDDEYEPEVSTILPRLKDCKSSANIMNVLQEEFIAWFGPSAIRVPIMKYQEIAEEIWGVWQEYGRKHLV